MPSKKILDGESNQPALQNAAVQLLQGSTASGRMVPCLRVPWAGLRSGAPVQCPEAITNPEPYMSREGRCGEACSPRWPRCQQFMLGMLGPPLASHCAESPGRAPATCVKIFDSSAAARSSCWVCHSRFSLGVHSSGIKGSSDG